MMTNRPEFLETMIAANAIGAIVVPRCRATPAARSWRRRCGGSTADRLAPLRLELLDERRFASGVVHLRYRVVN